MCKSNKSETSTSIPQWLQSAMQGFLGQASGLINSQTDPSKLVAPFNSEQQAAFGNIDAAQGYTPQAFSADAVNQYMSPYLGDVVNATEQQLNLQDNQQQNDLKGNVISSGAWGGDRSAVMQSELAGQQDTANNATIANLYNEGYGQAVGEFNNQQQLGLQANQQKIGAAEAQLGAGTLQQQNAQQIIDVPYQQLDFLGNLYGDLGGLFGGTSTTKTSQGFTFADGGKVPGYDDGGVTRNIFVPFGSEGMMPAHQARSAFHIPSPQPSQPQGGGVMSDISGLNSGLKDLGVNNGISGALSQGADALGFGDPASGAVLASPTQIPMAAAGDALSSSAIPLASAGDAAASTAATAGSGGLADLLALVGLKDGGVAQKFASGGGVLGLLDDPRLFGIAGAMMPQKLDDGGTVENDIVDANGNIVPVGAAALSEADTPPEWRGMATNYAPVKASPTQIPMAAAGDAQDTLPSHTPYSPDNPVWDDGTPVIHGNAGIAAAGTPQGLQQGYYNQNTYKPSPWLAAATGVLSALASRSLSKGALAGLQEYEQEANPAVDHSGSTVHIRYANGPDFDTGLPTMAALQAKALGDYRTGMLEDKAGRTDIAKYNAGLTPGTQTASPSGSSAPTDPYGPIADKIVASENGTGNPAAKNPLSSATGNGQFIDSTWQQMVSAVHPEWAQQFTPQQILAMRSDPALSKEMTEQYAQQNAPKIAASGHPVTPASLAMAHKLGPQAAISVMNAPQNAPLASVLPPQVMQANPQFAKMTAGQYAQGLASQFGTDAVASGDAASPKVFPKGMLSSPQTMLVDDGKGGQTPTLVQQDKRTGQWYSADQNRTQITKPGRIIPNSMMPTTMTPDAIDRTAAQYNLIGPSVLSGMYRDPIGRAAVVNRAAELASQSGQSAGDTIANRAGVKASTAALGQVEKTKAMVENFENTAMLNSKLALSLMDKGIGPTGSPLIDTWIRSGGKNIMGDADFSRFDNALTTFKNEYAKIMSGATGSQGSTDSARHEADGLISPNMSREQIVGNIQVMQQEMQNRMDSLTRQEQITRDAISGGGGSKSAAPSGRTATDKSGNTYTEQPNGKWVDKNGHEYKHP